MDILILAGLIILGWFFGSFINYASDVLPEHRRFIAVACPACNRSLPVMDYLLLRSCSQCGQRRAIRAWVVQILTMAALVGWWFYKSPTISFLEGLPLLLYFGVVIVIDMEHRLILHPVSLVGGVIALIIGTFRHGILNTLLGGLAGAGIMLAFYVFGFLFIKVAGKLMNKTTDEEALGFGDVALSAVLGLLLGWPGIAGNLILATLLGGAFSVLFIVFLLVTRRYQAFMAIPYGPFLVIAGVLMLIRPIGMFWI